MARSPLLCIPELRIHIHEGLFGGSATRVACDARPARDASMTLRCMRLIRSHDASPLSLLSRLRWKSYCSAVIRAVSPELSMEIEDSMASATTRRWEEDARAQTRATIAAARHVAPPMIADHRPGLVQASLEPSIIGHGFIPTAVSNDNAPRRRHCQTSGRLPFHTGRAQVNQRCSAAAGLSRRMWGEGPAGIAVQAHTACAVEA